MIAAAAPRLSTLRVSSASSRSRSWRRIGGLHFKSNAETASGALLLALGVFVLGEAVMRVRSGEAPDGMLMIGVAALAAVVNMAVLRLLTRYRDDGVHIRATWIFVGTAIGIYVCKEAVEILRVARAAQR